MLDSPAVARLDAAVDRWFEENLRGKPVADRAFYTASGLADHSVLWHLIGAANAFRQPHKPIRAVRLSASLGVESALVNLGIKRLFRRERPIHEAERPHALRTPLTSSFPSGHSSSAFMAAVILSEDSALAPAYFALATVVAASRIHVRIHHASDVLGGAVLGVALGVAVRSLWPRP